MNAIPAPAPLLEVRDLQTTFDLGRNIQIKAVDGVSFSVQPGEVIGIVGANGAGKSTLLKVLTRSQLQNQMRKNQYE